MQLNPNDPLFAAQLALAALQRAQQTAVFPLGVPVAAAPRVVQQRPSAYVSSARDTSLFAGPAPQVALVQPQQFSGVGRLVRGGGAVVGGLIGGKAGAALGIVGWLFTGSAALGLGVFAAGAVAGVGLGYLVSRAATRAVGRMIQP